MDSVESVSGVLCCKNAMYGLLVLPREARREEFLLEEFNP